MSVRTGVRLAMAVAVLLVGANCSSSDKDGSPVRKGAPPPGSAFATEVGRIRQRTGMVFGDGRVLAFTAAELIVKQDVTVERVDLVASSNVELVATRLHYLVRQLDKVRLPSSIGLACFDTWPPEGYGPTFEAAGAPLRKGDEVGVLVYLRPTGVGDFGSGSVRLTYRAPASGPRREQQFDNVQVTGGAFAAASDTQPERLCDTIVPSWRTPPIPQNACLTKPDTPCENVRGRD